MPRVRDGKRALAMTQELLKSHRNTELGETMAMALAEVGAYGDAVTVQRDVLESARQAGEGGRRPPHDREPPAVSKAAAPPARPGPTTIPAFTTPVRLEPRARYKIEPGSRDDVTQLS